MRDFFVILAFVVTILAACSSGSDDIYEYEEKVRTNEELEAEIAQYLENMPIVTYAAVQVTGGTAVVAIDLEGEHNTKEVTLLKRGIISDVKAKCSTIKHVAVTTSPDMYKKIFGAGGSGLETDSEIFEIAVPMP
ncbi:MAG: YhcN/YlaJ family sporulation lipoprotein [Defluviitaleaceae bacterium]|nr:YhcN/YlaJ family sporulation lipoprotein [Defluviitaleaceae bacterium]